jgi:hypothetical protein
MLFDLRGRGRRRTVQIIYVGLALLMGVGLVGFGIGGGFGSGGILNSGSSGEGGGGTSYASKVSKYKKLVAAKPKDISAWEQLTNAQLLEAGGEQYLTSSGLTSKGKELFSEVAQSWNSYLALNPPTPSSTLAQRMLTVFSEQGLNEPSEAVQALEIAVVAHPTSAALYSDLAIYAYKSKNVREGDLASEKAVSLAPATEQKRLKSELEAYKKNPSGNGESSATSAASEGTSQVITVTTTSAAAKSKSATSSKTSATKTK